VTKRKTLVYVAGPISRGDLVDNVRRAHDAGMVLLKAGYSVIVPHGSCFWGNNLARYALRMEPRDAFVPEVLPHGTTHQDWYGMDLEIVRRCDAVVRLPGESVGADGEAAEARRLGIPVYGSVEELLAGNIEG
jgi:hypothetical protein